MGVIAGGGDINGNNNNNFTGFDTLNDPCFYTTENYVNKNTGVDG